MPLLGVPSRREGAILVREGEEETLLRRSLPPRFLRFFRDSIRSRSSLYNGGKALRLTFWTPNVETTDGGELPWVTALIDEAQQWRRFSSSEVDDIPPSAAVACDGHRRRQLRA
nr:hypothetical protein Iba_chr11eCG6420 [Ipomoea batatas]